MQLLSMHNVWHKHVSIPGKQFTLQKDFGRNHVNISKLYSSINYQNRL